MDKNAIQTDTVIKCLTDKCGECTGFYVSRLFGHRLVCKHKCHKSKRKALDQVGRPGYNAILSTPSSQYGDP